MKRIVIAPYEAHKNLYAYYRKDNPFSDVKFFTLESFIKEANYQNDERSILFLTKKYDLDYELANECLFYLKKIHLNSSEDPKIKKLIEMRNELIKNNLIFKNTYFDYEISHADIDIYFYSEKNIELRNIIKNKSYRFIKDDNNSYPDIYLFDNNAAELTYVFNKICKLIDEGVSPNNISLYGLNEDDKLTFYRLKDNYHLNFNNAYPKTLLEKQYINRFLSEAPEVGIDEAIKNVDSSDETYEDFARIIKNYRVEGIDLAKQVNIYKAIFAKTRLKEEKYVEAISIVHEPIVKNDGYLFIINFVQNSFPKITKDNTYLSDPQKSELGLLTSELTNSINLDEGSNYLQQNGHIFVSMCLRSNKQKYQPSPLVKLRELNVISKTKNNEFYSLNEAKLTYANLLDLRKNYLDSNSLLEAFKRSDIKINYRSYDYRYKKVKHYIPENVLKLSYSQVKTFYQCQFKYYLDRVIALDETETNFNMNIGNLAHAIFERIDEDKTYDELFNEEYSKIDSFDKYDWVYIRRIKEEIRKTFDYIKRFENQIDRPTIYREISGSSKDKEIKLDNNTTLVGKIDKLIIFNDKYFTIIDYKMGREEFSANLVEYGLSLQLPTYALIAKESDRFYDKKLAGLFIQRFLVAKAVTSKVSDEDEDKPLLTGLYLNDTNVISKLDSSLSMSPSNYIQSCKLKKDGSFYSGRERDEEYFDSIAETSRKLILDASKKILSNDFEINPKIVKGKNKSCEFCPYRDICYRDERAYKIISNGTGAEDGAD